MNSHIAQGKFYWSAEFLPYMRLRKKHRSLGLTNIIWNTEQKRYLVDTIVVLFPEDQIDKPKAAISFTGYFTSKHEGELSVGDTLKLTVTNRIGVDYASETSKIVEQPLNEKTSQNIEYEYPVDVVQKDASGVINKIEVSLFVSEITEGTISLKRLE
jgi:hypothetical protein